MRGHLNSIFFIFTKFDRLLRFGRHFVIEFEGKDFNVSIDCLGKISANSYKR